MEEIEDEEELLEFSDSDEDADDEIIEQLSEKRKQMRKQDTVVKLMNEDDKKSENSELSETELSDNALEEKEAKSIQRRHAEQISERDFDYEFAQLMKAADVIPDKKVAIQEDLSDLSNKQKWQLIRNTSPDLIPVIHCCKSLLPTCSDALSCRSFNSADVRANLSIDFCMNIGMYLILKILDEPDVHCHPVTQRLVDYQLLMRQLESAETEPKRQTKTKAERLASPEMLASSSDEEEKSAAETQAGDTADVGRRTITDQIQRNRGLTPHRNKEYKNPRVKHRLKYRKAVSRRRGQIRPVRKELAAYAGEISGIRAAVKRGVRLKT